MRGVLAQVWTAPKCESGAVALGALPDVVSDTWTEARGSTSAGQLVMRRDALQASSIAVGRIIRIVSAARGVVEWVVTQIDDGVGAGTSPLVTVRCSPIRALLGLRGLVRTLNPPADAVVAFTPTAMTPAAALSLYVLSNQSVDGLGWLSLGTVDDDQPITLAAFQLQTRGQVLAAIEAATQMRAVFRPLPNDAGYALDLLIDPGASLGPAHLSLADGAAAVTRQQDASRAPTVLVPVTPSGTLVGATAWRVTAVSGNWITLRDPDALTDLSLSPVPVDGALVGAFLRRGATISRIVASRASDGAVEVESATGFAVNQLVSLAQDAGGTTLFSLPSAPAIAARGVIAGTVRVAGVRSERNLLEDSFAQTLGGSGWTTIGSGEAVAWSTAATETSGQADGAVSPGATSITLKNFPASTTLYRHQPLRIASQAYEATADTLVSTTGTATVPITPTVVSEISGGTQLVWADAGVAQGTGTANGTQTVGASSLVLQGLPATRAWVSGDTLTASGQEAATAFANVLSSRTATVTATLPSPGLPIDLPSGFPVTLRETWIVMSGTFTGAPVYVETRGTASSAYTAGASSLAMSMPGRNVVAPFAPTASLSLNAATITSDALSDFALTVSGTPTWGVGRTATVSITGTTPSDIAAGTPLRWQRGAETIGTVTATSFVASGASSLSVTGTPALVRVIEDGQTLTLAGGRVYVTTTTTLSGSGGGAVPITAAPSISDNAAVIAEAPSSWGDGPMGAAPALIRGATGSSNGVQSPLVTVPGTGSVSLVARVQWRLWTPLPGTGSTQPQVTVTGASAVTNTVTLPDTNAVTFVQTATSTVTGGSSARVTLSRNATLASRFEWVEHVMLTVGSDTAVPFTAGAFANVALRTALTALGEASQGARFRIRGAALQAALDALGDAVPTLAIGQRVRLRLPDMAVDVTLRVEQLAYSWTNPDSWTLDVGGIPPRLASIDVIAN